MPSNYFSGSYLESDVRILLKPICVENTTVVIKEALIQSGAKHYSQLLTHEKPPSERYLALFHQALAANQARMAEHVLRLAGQIVATRKKGITLVSLARAGTPVGVLLKRVLEQYFACHAEHYSISIVRDRGIDTNALLHILERHSPESLVFVDGWTGKGVIARELAHSLEVFAARTGIIIPAELYVLADLCGQAFMSASTEDYLIPSSILNATVSGLISRSVLDDTQLHPTDFHGCHFYQEFDSIDLSLLFIETLMQAVDEQCKARGLSAYTTDLVIDPQQKIDLQQQSQYFLNWVSEVFGTTHLNLIKPGIGEATRVLLRREADVLLLQQTTIPEVQHLLYLAQTKQINVVCEAGLPYRAAALIREL